MIPFRRGAAPGPTPPSAASDGWAETRVEPGSAQGWAQTRVDATAAADGWSETRAQTALATKLADDADDYLAAGPEDIGRLTSADLRELFVSCAPAEALQQQLDHLQPEFIAVHDIGASASAMLLESIASASGRRVQKLVIRRQGFGNALATLPFVDVATEQGRSLRLYATGNDDEATRTAIARTLLGFSRLGVVMVGDLPAAAMEAALRPLREAMEARTWRNRQLLLLPLAAASSVASHGIALGRNGIAVRTTPQVARPADAWAFIAASWSRFGDAGATLDVKTSGPGPAPAPVQTPAVEPNPDVFERYLRQLGDIAGLVGCCIFDAVTGRVAAHAGAGTDALQLALHGGQLLTAMGVASRSLGYGRLLPDAAITLGAHHLLLRGVPRHPALAMHVVLDKHVANLTLARLQLQRMDALFDAPPG